MKFIKPLTQTQGGFERSSSFQLSGQAYQVRENKIRENKIRENKLLLMSLFLTSSLFTIALTSLPQWGVLQEKSSTHRSNSAATATNAETINAETINAETVPVINLQINQSPAPTKVIVNVLVYPGNMNQEDISPASATPTQEPASAVPFLASPTSTTGQPTIIVNYQR